MITVRCSCGEEFHADEAHLGKAIRCRCGRVLNIAAENRGHEATGKKSVETPRKSTSHAGSVVALIAAGVFFVSVFGLLSRPSTRADTRTSPDPAIPELVAPVCNPSNVTRPNSSDGIGRASRGGLGQLRIINGTESDAVANLIDASSGLPQGAIYVRARESGDIMEIPRGVYRLQFLLGSSWYRDRLFCDVVGAFEFDDVFDFEERQKQGGIEYSTFKVTLHPVPRGTATTHTIALSEFELPPPMVP